MDTYIVTHTHKHGTSNYLVQSEATPTVKQVVRCLDIDFEPEYDEFIDIDCITDKPVLLTWQEDDSDEPEPEPAGSRDRDEWKHEAAQQQRLK